MPEFLVEVTRVFAYRINTTYEEEAVKRALRDEGPFESRFVKETVDVEQMANTTGASEVHALNEFHMQSKDDRFTKYEGQE